MLAAATTASTGPLSSTTMSSTPPLSLNSKSAWANGPPRSLTTSTLPLPLVPTDSPATPSTSASTNDTPTSVAETTGTSSTDPEPFTPSSPVPLRPQRNPARKAVNADYAAGSSCVAPTHDSSSLSPGAGANTRGRSRTSDKNAIPSSEATNPATPRRDSFSTQSKPAALVSTSTPAPTELESRNHIPTRDHVSHKGLGSMETVVPEMPMLPPLPMYPPPLPPAVKSTLQPDAVPFVPKPMPRRPSAAIVIKKPNGEEINLKQIANKPSQLVDPGGPAYFIPAAPSTVIKIESEAERARRLHLQGLAGSTTTLDARNHSDGTISATEDVDEYVAEDGSEVASEDGESRNPMSGESVEAKSPNHHDEDTSVSAGQESAIDEETGELPGQQLEIPRLATSPPTASLDSGFPLAVLNPPRRSRSRRGSNRQGDGTGADGEPGLKKMTRTRSGRGGTNRGASREGLTRTRSGGPRRRQHPGRLDVSGVARPSVLNTGLIADAISNARMILDVRKVIYPEQDGIFGPAKELNQGVEDGKFRYDRDFLFQFRGLCNEKPHGMAELEEIALEPGEQQAPTRSGRRRRSTRSSTDGPLSTPAIVTDGMALDSSTLTLSTTPLTGTEERFPAISPLPLNPSLPPPASLNRTSSRGGRARNSSTASKLSINTSSSLPPPAFPMTRSISHGSSRVSPSATSSATSTLSPRLSPPTPLDRRSKSLRVRKRSSSARTERPVVSGPVKSPAGAGQFPPGFANFMNDARLLEPSVNRWVPSSVGLARTGPLGRTTLSGSSPIADPNSPETVERKVKALLNKLTMEMFDSISDQIVAWANKSEAETDGRTLTLVIKLVFDKATDEATWSTMYAKLCRKMMEQISMEITDDGVKDKMGRPIAGGQLFRQYLLSRCQADFERGWSARETLEEQQSAAAAACGAAPGEVVFSDEYYALQKAKRRGLGLVKFIGELFKLQMLTERIMHRCILKLLDEPAEEDIESVCQLLKTVGGALSGPKGKESMDMYFGKMNSLSQDPQVSQRIRFMLLDVIELRARNWVPKTQVALPSTLAQVHEAAAKEASEKSVSKPIPMMKVSSRRGQNRSDTNPQKDADSWISSAGQLGRSVTRVSGTSLASTLGSVGDMAKSPTAAKSPLTPNMSHSLARLSSEPGTSRMTRIPSEPGKSRSRRGGEANRQINRRTSVDFVQLDAAIDSGNTGRKRLQLLPRTVATVSSPTDENIPDAPSLTATVEEPPSMTEAQARAKVDEDIKEFMQIRDLTEATGYFESLPSTFRHLLVDRFASKVDAKEAEIALIAELFSRISISGTCTAEVFERGFAPTVEALDDISLDAPAAYATMARFLRASKVSQEAVDRLAGLINIYGSPIVHPRDKLLKEFAHAT